MVCCKICLLFDGNCKKAKTLYAILCLQIKDCTISYISANSFEELEYLDYFGIEMSPLLLMSSYGMFGLSVEKLTTDTHTIPQNFGMFEMLYSALPSNSVPAGLLTHWKNLTAVTIKVNIHRCSVKL